jgi:ADP-ribosylglycohydrolase|nr:ADP-ribosylglycohydrolase family protein [Kofleriaceae bacterium]
MEWSDRAEGALMGLAVGDALGTTYEFERIAQPAYPALATGPAIDVVGAGPFGLAPGQITDDTQLAVCLARSLQERAGLDLADVARRYVAWEPEAFDVGSQTRASIRRLARGESPSQAARGVWRDSGRMAAGNGSLMRIAPLAVWGSAKLGDVAALARGAVDESLITHADPRCALACAGYVVAMASALRGGGDVVAQARLGADAARAYLARAWRDDPADVAAIDAAAHAIASDLDAALAAEPGVYGDELHLHRTAGFVRVAFRLAMWHAVHAPSWRAAVVDVASRGGDADTNAAIVGALVGARDGVAAIPAAWRERVLAAVQNGGAEWADRHHPRWLLGLVRGT